MCVLIVEDDRSQARTMVQELRPAGYEIITTSTISETVEALDRYTIDLAALDLELGGGMSFPVLHILRATGVPFVVLAGRERERFREGLRGVTVLEKPLQEGALTRAISLLSERIPRRK